LDKASGRTWKFVNFCLEMLQFGGKCGVKHGWRLRKWMKGTNIILREWIKAKLVVGSGGVLLFLPDVKGEPCMW